MITRYRPSSIYTVYYSLRPLFSSRTNFSVPRRTNQDGRFPPVRDSSILLYLSDALRISAKLGFFDQGRQVHACLVKSGFSNVLSLQNQLLHVYVKCKEYLEAFSLFGEIPVRNVVTWNTLICGVIHCGSNGRQYFHQVICSFKTMLIESVNPDYLTFNGLFRACVEIDDVEIGMQLHSFVVKYGILVNCFVSIGLISLYGKFRLIGEAKQVFFDLSFKDLAVWNALLSCYAFTESTYEALQVYDMMRLEGVEGDEFTFSTLLACLASPGFLQPVKQIHVLIVKLGLDVDVLVASTLVDAYAKSDHIDDAYDAFRFMPVKNVISWNTVIVGYGRLGDRAEAMGLLQEMLHKGFKPDELTLASVISSCGNDSSMSEVGQVHASTIKVGFLPYLSVLNSLINAYSKCGSVFGATQCFNLVEEPDIVTWTSIICGYGFHGLAKEAVAIFLQMLSRGIEPDKIAFLGVINACAHAGMIKEGLYYFNLMINTYHLVLDVEQYTCLIDLVARAGLLDEAYAALTSMPQVDPSTFGALLGACKVHGNEELAARVVEMLFMLEPSNPVNYALMSNVYASDGMWAEVSRMRKIMRNRCSYKVPGFSWIEIAGDVHTFVSSDRFHSKSTDIYAILSVVLLELEEEEDVDSPPTITG